MSLSPAATIVLTRAAERPDHRLEFHRKLPTGGRHKMIDALLRDGLIAETLGDYRLGDGATLIEDAATGLMLTTLRITDAGLAAVGHAAPAETAAAQDTDTAPHAATDAAVAQEAAAVTDALEAATSAPLARTTLRQAAQAVLAAWDDEANREVDIIAALEGPMDILRSLLAERAPRATAAASRTPRTGTKQETVLALLRRDEGASGPQIAEATGWAAHTVRGFLAGLKKKGFTIETLDRVRMVGPNKEGAKGSYTVYRIAG
ncbi:MAG: hypothetical protein BGP12_09615 [Rhodospirillales bacterium 70-18]|nr:MAG: hypothetical protein BGP12_09615 [Rhodospirillales bacterium 70-18]